MTLSDMSPTLREAFAGVNTWSAGSVGALEHAEATGGGGGVETAAVRSPEDTSETIWSFLTVISAPSAANPTRSHQLYGGFMTI